MKATKVELERRGVRHGRFAVEARGARFDGSDADFAAHCVELWRADRPIVLPGAVGRQLPHFRAEIAASRAMFERVRRGGSFEDELAARLDRQRVFRPAGATIDAGDTREIAKVFADGCSGARPVARDLYAKLSWIAHDERDTSLRIRFSFGSEALLDWQSETRRAPWADRFAAAAFPECAAITDTRELVQLIERLIGRRARFSERIIYSNAPGGGALFHHDDEEHQLGVVYSQLQGETAWLALPKRELAQCLSKSARGALRMRAATARKALRVLDDTADPALDRLLNATPAFTRELVARGALRRLRAGDSILLPSHGPDDVCWHSVFALGRAPSLAHSYGIFALRR